MTIIAFMFKEISKLSTLYSAYYLNFILGTRRFNFIHRDNFPSLPRN